MNWQGHNYLEEPIMLLELRGRLPRTRGVLEQNHNRTFRAECEMNVQWINGLVKDELS